MIRNLALFSALILASACTTNEAAPLGLADSFDSSIQGRMSGDMPEVGSFDSNVTRGYANTDWGFLDLELHTVGDFGWTMVYASADIDDDGNVSINPDDVIGCTGPDDGTADFDETSTDAEIVTEIVTIDGQEFLEIELTADFNGGTVLAVATTPVGE